MTEKTKKIKDILEEAEGISCPVKKTLFFVDEFLRGPMCGKCFPCSFGSYEAKQRLLNISSALGTDEDIDAMRQIGNKMQLLSMCKRGKDTANILLENIESEAFKEHLRGLCAEKECAALIEYRNVQDKCIRCGLCKDVCKFDAIIGEKQVSVKCCYLPFEIRQKRCTKCGECIKVCPTNAIVIVNIENEATVSA
jgi:formate hydrogenlyase subunit 6/NADH:ubiquinone oxidoreductase subunit I